VIKNSKSEDSDNDIEADANKEWCGEYGPVCVEKGHEYS